MPEVHTQAFDFAWEGLPACRPFLQAGQHGGLQLLRFALPHTGQRQTTGALQTLQACLQQRCSSVAIQCRMAALLPVRHKLLLQLLDQLVGLQTIELEQLVVFNRVLIRFKVHTQTLLKNALAGWRTKRVSLSMLKGSSASRSSAGMSWTTAASCCACASRHSRA